jgi:hypothetical protein
MTIQKLQESIQELLKEGKLKPETEVVFQHSIHEYDTIYSNVDYLLYTQKPGGLVLCYDDGHFV